MTPGPLAPARELLGFMLLEAGHAKEALVAFEATMKKEPNRFRGIYGGARAAEAAGDKAKAATYYKKLLEVAQDADTERPEFSRARRPSLAARADSARKFPVVSCQFKVEFRSCRSHPTADSLSTGN